MNSCFAETPPIIYEYLVYMETVRGKSQRTTDAYYRDIRLFFRFIKHKYNLVDKNISIDEIDISDVDISLVKKIILMDAYEFLLYCKNERSNNNKTRARKVSTLRSYFKYLTVRAKYLDINPIDDLESPKPAKTLPKHLTLDQSKKLLKSIDGPYASRNYAIITIFLNCGLRLSELCAININHLDFENSVFRVIGKGNKERLVYLNDACVSALKDYLKDRLSLTTKDKNALFISRNGTRISRRMVEQVVTDCLKKSGLDGMGFSTHKLRHTAATLMYQHGNVDVRVLQEILGHENLGTTQIYTHLSTTQLEEASKANPLSDVKK